MVGLSVRKSRFFKFLVREKCLNRVFISTRISPNLIGYVALKATVNSAGLKKNNLKKSWNLCLQILNHIGDVRHYSDVNHTIDDVLLLKRFSSYFSGFVEPSLVKWCFYLNLLKLKVNSTSLANSREEIWN